METRHIRVFLMLAEELHFGRTAARLRVAQSAVSQTIKALEKELGVTLFERTQRRVVLTAAGKELASHSRDALDGLERGAQAARKAAKGETGRLMLRFTMMSALTRLPRAVARFQALYPNVELQIAPGGSTEQLEAIARGQCDIGFVSLKKGVAPLATEIVEGSTLVGLFAKAHPLARRKFIGFESFSDARCIFLSENSEPGIRMMFRRRFAELQMSEPRVVLEVDQVETLLAFVAVGFGVSFCPAFVERLPFTGVSIIPIRPAVPCGISAVWNPAALSATATKFLEVLHAERDCAL